MTAAPMEIDVKTLQTMKAKAEPLFILDVREESEFAKCRIAGAKLIPLGVLPSRIAEIPKDMPVIVHCHHGGRSMRAVTWLRQNGFDNSSNLAGGIDAWSREIDASVPRY